MNDNFSMTVKKEMYFDTVEIPDISIESVDFYTGCKPLNLSSNSGNLLCSARRQGDYDFYTGLITHTGIGGYFRLVNKDGRSEFDGVIATSGADLNIDISFKAGDIISINLSKPRRRN